jgi:outer membrane murein-binding lipoprotein Lpp
MIRKYTLYAVLTALLVLAGCAGSFSKTADALEQAGDDVAYYQEKVEEARLSNDSEALEVATQLLDLAKGEVDRLSEIAQDEIAKGGPDDAQWAGAAGQAISTYGGPFGVLGLALGAFADFRRRQWKLTTERVTKSIADTSLLKNADADTRKRVEEIQGPKVTAKVKEIVAKNTEARGG